MKIKEFSRHEGFQFFTGYSSYCAIDPGGVFVPPLMQVSQLKSVDADEVVKGLKFYSKKLALLIHNSKWVSLGSFEC